MLQIIGILIACHAVAKVPKSEVPPSAHLNQAVSNTQTLTEDSSEQLEFIVWESVPCQARERRTTGPFRPVDARIFLLDDGGERTLGETNADGEFSVPKSLLRSSPGGLLLFESSGLEMIGVRVSEPLLLDRSERIVIMIAPVVR